MARHSSELSPIEMVCPSSQEKVPPSVPPAEKVADPSALAVSRRKRSGTLPRIGPETGKGRSLNLLPDTEISQLRCVVSVEHFSDHLST